MKKTVIDGEEFILEDEEDIDEETLIEISNNKGEEGDD